jgi:hypothetical protein
LAVAFAAFCALLAAVEPATLSCEKCFSPTFQKRDLYLPFCSGDKSR